MTPLTENKKGVRAQFSRDSLCTAYFYDFHFFCYYSRASTKYLIFQMLVKMLFYCILLLMGLMCVLSSIDSMILNSCLDVICALLMRYTHFFSFQSFFVVVVLFYPLCRAGFLLSLISIVRHLIRVHSYSPLMLLLGTWTSGIAIVRCSCEESTHGTNSSGNRIKHILHSNQKMKKKKKSNNTNKKTATAKFHIESILQVYPIHLVMSFETCIANVWQMLDCCMCECFECAINSTIQNTILAWHPQSTYTHTLC